MRELLRENRGFFVAVAVALAVVALAAPLVALYDEHVDRTRALFADRQRMAELQHHAVRREGRPRAVAVGPGRTVRVAGRSFTASPGATVRVRVVPGGFCVRASHAEGEGTPWRCWSDGTDPAEDFGVPRPDDLPG